MTNRLLSMRCTQVNSANLFLRGCLSPTSFLSLTPAWVSRNLFLGNLQYSERVTTSTESQKIAQVTQQHSKPLAEEYYKRITFSFQSLSDEKKEAARRDKICFPRISPSLYPCTCKRNRSTPALGAHTEGYVFLKPYIKWASQEKGLQILLSRTQAGPSRGWGWGECSSHNLVIAFYITYPGYADSHAWLIVTLELSLILLG